MIEMAGEAEARIPSAAIGNAAEVPRDIFPIMDRFYRDQGYKLRCGRDERVFRVSAGDGSVLAAARLLARGDRAYWLRNMLVVHSQRGQGVGSQLLIHMLGTIAPGRCYCYAVPQAAAFYARHGFIEPLVDECPPLIAEGFRKYKSRGRDWVLMCSRTDGQNNFHFNDSHSEA